MTLPERLEALMALDDDSMLALVSWLAFSRPAVFEEALSELDAEKLGTS